MVEASVTNVWRTPQLWWRIAIVVVCTVGLLSGVPRMAYFTSQSCLAVVVYFAIAVWRMVVRRTTDAPAPRMRGGVTLWVGITCVVAHVILSNGANPFASIFHPDSGAAMTSQTVILHYSVPIMVLIDWVVFGPHGIVLWRDALLWMLFPVGYGVLTLLRAAAFPGISDRFPYPFLDFETLGAAGTAIAMTRIFIIIAVMAVCVIALDRAAHLVARGARRRGVDKSARPALTEVTVGV